VSNVRILITKLSRTPALLSVSRSLPSVIRKRVNYLIAVGCNSVIQLCRFCFVFCTAIRFRHFTSSRNATSWVL